jgi:hypothetical protein
MKRITLVCLSLLSLGSLSACGQSQAEPDTAKQNSEIVLRDAQGAANYRYLLEHPEVAEKLTEAREAKEAAAERALVTVN